MKVFFSDRAFASVLAETTEKIKTETGGLFLGKVVGDSWYIVEAIDPGPKSVFEVAYFEYDKNYTQHLINKIANLYQEKLELIGLWHRHPGSFDHFSSTDDGTNAKYASMRKEGAISGLVNIDPTFRFTMYHVARPCAYRKIAYEVGDDLIPDELLKYKTPDRFYDLMKKRLSGSSRRRSAEPEYTVSVSLESFMEFILPQLGNECEDPTIENDISEEELQMKLTEGIIDDLTFMVDTVGIRVEAVIKEQFLVISQETVDKTTRIYFMYQQEKDQIIFSYGDKCYQYHSGLFQQASIKAAQEKAKQANAEQANAEQEKAEQANAEQAQPDKPDKEKKQKGLFGTVKKIIPFRKDEK